MYTSKFRSLRIDNNSIANSTQDEDSADTLLDSAITLLQMGREVPKQSWFTTSRTLRLLSLILHSALVTIHLAFVGIWAGGLEHRFTFALENQKLVSFLISATMTAFGTIYSALLVFATQTLSVRRSLQLDQMLTATHDNAAAWAGVGAAISHLWSQKTVPARVSMIGVVTAALYLMTILGLHITTSSLFSLVTVNSTSSSSARTYGLPSFNSSPDVFDLDEMQVYAAGSLYSLPSILDSATSLGLHDGTLYDVLNIDTVAGNATVSASGFNVTCGYVVGVAGLQSYDSSEWTAEGVLYIHITQPGMISTAADPQPFSPSILLYSTIPIVDSSLKTGPLFNLSPPMNTSVSSIQIFRCSLSLVNQTAIVDAQSRQLQALEPDLKKTDSTWVPYVPPLNNATTNGNSFIDNWAIWYDSMPVSDFPLAFGYSPVMASVADVYLIQKLNLPAANNNSTLNVTLHEVENALSVIVASMFWTCKHKRTRKYYHDTFKFQWVIFPPSHRALGSSGFVPVNGTSGERLSDVPKGPILLQGNVTVTEIFTQARLELSIIAVSAGLAISITLMLLALPSLLFHQGSTHDNDLTVNGTGILHAIWLYRNHPELDILLEQVEHPTDDNLRAAGLVQTRLLGGRVQKEGSNESFLGSLEAKQMGRICLGLRHGNMYNDKRKIFSFFL
ncbi:hypothetical protein MVEN_01631900 [Mycena venus]|uniref:Uncharacterized protein n=1 Tax=Mycena venus TaxID=2733690 RepID=A0A8H7CQN3_9AGAR|nr:hypothetical protein MVEN_01631900 [Mycena venus]